MYKNVTLIDHECALADTMERLTLSDDLEQVPIKEYTEIAGIFEAKGFKVKQSSETQLLFISHDELSVNSMYPAREIAIDKYHGKVKFTYRGQDVTLPHHLKQIHTKAKADELVQFAATMTKCQGIDYHPESLPADILIEKDNQNKTTYRSKNCTVFLKNQTDIRCTECTRKYNLLRKQLERKRKTPTLANPHEDLKKKLKNATAQAVYHRKQHHKYKEEAIRLRDADHKDVTTMFEAIDKDEELMNELDERRKKLWEAQRTCNKGKQNKWDPE